MWGGFKFILDQILSGEFDVTTESASEEAKSSVLCVSNLPSNVTEVSVYISAACC